MKQILRPFFALALILAVLIPALADTIRLKDGSVIRGQVVGFKDQQFTILIGSGAQGRRSRTLIYVEDIESIEFDAATTSAASSLANEPFGASNSSRTTTEPARSIPPSNTRTSSPRSSRSGQPSPNASPLFFTVKATVTSDRTSNGWTNSSLVVKKGQRLRINATGRIALGKGQFSTPTGNPNASANDKLMSTVPVGALIAVIGDDNDTFFLVGNRLEFVAERDGVLFLGVNDSEEGLADNVGTYDVVIEAEATP